jgi:hypothetical protein
MLQSMTHESFVSLGADLLVVHLRKSSMSGWFITAISEGMAVA